MSVQLGKEFPNFKADSTIGHLDFHQYITGSWAIMFSHPADYTPVCTTELGAVVKHAPEFEKRGVKLIGFSIDRVEDHKGWIEDIKHYNSVNEVNFPLIAGTRELASQFGMLDPDEIDGTGMPLTARCVFIIGPDKKLKLSILYPASTGRNFNEIIRVLDSLQLTANHKVATPANWKSGDRCMVVPNLSDEQASARFSEFTKADLPSGKGYIRTTPDPSK